MKWFQFGETVDGYTVPVLNEREVRAAAGIFFVVLLLAATRIGHAQDFTMLKYAVVFFLIDFAIRVFVSPRYAPSLILGRLMVRNQTPEYVGAPQKKFAWIIGLVLAVVMFVHLVLFNAYSPITGLSCMICLVFLFLESSFGICLGCMVYNRLFKQKALYCPGEVCEVKSRHAIQKVTMPQIAVLLLAIIVMIGVGLLFHNHLQTPAINLLVNAH